MDQTLSPQKVTLLFLAIVLVLCSGRLVTGRFNSSYFIVAGSDFVDAAKTPSPVIVQKGQGYDGQFFYRYALNPFDLKKNDLGVNVDHPPYRVQRIAYPFLAWVLSFGGIPAAVPYALILLNILAFIGVSFYTNKLVALVNGYTVQGLLPLLLCGIYMSIARDLAEVPELFFFTGAVYYVFRPRYSLFCVFATLTVFSRETSMIAIAPLAGLVFARSLQKGFKADVLLYSCLPFLVFLGWKAIIYSNMPSLAEATVGYGSIGIPLKGIVMGFKENFNFSTTKNGLQFLFWIAYLGWQVWFVLLVFTKVPFRQMNRLDNVSILKIIYLCWLVFAVCFSDNIYGDDWGFVRIFSLWNMVGFMLLIAGKRQTGWLFNSCSAVMALLTIARLIVRV